jgi:hypothetical protein
MTYRSILLSGLLLTAAGFFSCESIQTAPKGSARIEVQVVYEVDESFYSPFVKDVNRGAIQRILEESVQPLADIGMRFYAIPSSNYEKGQTTPDYVMTIRAVDCTPDLRVTKTKKQVPIEGEHAEKEDGDKKEGDKKEGDKKEKEKPKTKEVVTIKANLYSVACKLEVKLQKRRNDAPALIVGNTKGTGSSSKGNEDKSLRLGLHKKADEENDSELTEKMLQGAFAGAASRAFGELQKPIDRELAPLSKPTSGSAK